MLSGAATATAAVLLAFPFHSSFPDKIAKVSVLVISNLHMNMHSYWKSLNAVSHSATLSMLRHTQSALLLLLHNHVSLTVQYLHSALLLQLCILCGISATAISGRQEQAKTACCDCVFMV